MLNLIGTAIRSLLDRRRMSLERSLASDVRALLGEDAIALLDVGASGGIISRWRPYRQNIAFTGIEPDERSIPALLRSPEAGVFKSYDIVPSGVWNRTGKLRISLTRKPMCSSHFLPNSHFLSRFPDVERFDIVGATEVECRTVDELLASSGNPVDFIKLDLEGGELAVLEGAGNTIKRCMGLHVEVCFQSMREGQPLFGDLAKFLQQHGFEFVDFVSFFRWERDSLNGLGQAIFADALFLRGPESLLSLAEGDDLTSRSAKAYLAILVVYERFDLALKFLDLVHAAGAPLVRSEIERFASILRRRKTHFDRRYRFVVLLGRMFARLAGPNYCLHYIY